MLFFVIIQGIELLLKHVLKLEHPILIYENIDKPHNTVSINQALNRLESISKIKLDEKEKRVIKKANNYRNLILHYELTFNNIEFKRIYCMLFEFVHYFHKKHLNKDLHEVILAKYWKNEAELINYFRERFVYYNGVEMDKSTPREIVKYQKYNGIRVNNKNYERIKFGDEKFSWGSDVCGDCGCLKGQFHTDGCDIEECPILWYAIFIM